MRIKLMQFSYNAKNYIGRKFFYNKNSPVINKFENDVYYDTDKDKRRSMDIYFPNEGESHPVLIMFHGGGWVTGDKDNLTQTAKIFADKGYLVFNVNYRLSPEFPYPIPVRDVSKAIAWVYSNAGNLGGDTSRIFLAGDCAGAHLVSLYAAISANEKLSEEIKLENMLPINAIKGILLFYGMFNLKTIDKMNFSTVKEQNKSFLGNDPALYEKHLEFASPVFYINEKFPPVFLCVGERDDFYMQTIELIQELRNNKIPHKFIAFNHDEYPNSRHGFLVDIKRRCTKKAVEAAGHFIDYYSNRYFNSTSYL